MQALAKDADPGVALQVLMTGKLLSSADAKLWPDYSKFAQQTMLVSPSTGVKTLGTMLLTGADKVGGQEFNAAEIAVLEKGQAIFKEVCFACHGFDGKGMPMDGLRPGTTIAPPLAGSPTVRSHPDAVPLVLLNGLAGPIGGKTYDAQMVPMNTNDDEWIAAVASYVRNAFGNHGAIVSAGGREASARGNEGAQRTRGRSRRCAPRCRSRSTARLESHGERESRKRGARRRWQARYALADRGRAEIRAVDPSRTAAGNGTSAASGSTNGKRRAITRRLIGSKSRSTGRSGRAWPRRTACPARARSFSRRLRRSS